MIAELLKSLAAREGGQVIVTTHSAILLDSIELESLYMCKRKEGRTVISPLFSEPQGIATSNQEDELLTSERILRGDFDA